VVAACGNGVALLVACRQRRRERERPIRYLNVKHGLDETLPT
jgi:hypothetical protein